jgi:hypothetical protein
MADMQIISVENVFTLIKRIKKGKLVMLSFVF